MSNYFEQQLLEYPGRRIRQKADRALLDRIVNKGLGAIRTLPRWAAREFCDPGLWIKARLHPEALTPAELKTLARTFRNDEWWGLCLIAISTGSKLLNGKDPFREGITHSIDPDTGELIGLQDLLDVDPDTLLGQAIAGRAEALLGLKTVLIVVKRFVNAGPIPFHFHFDGPFEKAEVHDIIWQDCARHKLDPWHGMCHAIGLKPDTTDADFRRCLENWGRPGGNGILDLAQWHRMPAGLGTYKCPPLLLHAPGALPTHETHWPRDQHGLVQDRFREFREPALSPEGAFASAPSSIYREAGKRYDDWDYLMSLMNLPLNRRTDLMGPDFFSPNRKAEQYCDTGVNAFWSCHGKTPGLLETSILRLELEPGAQTVLNGLPSSGFFFLSQGEGMVAGLKNRLRNRLKFDGKDIPEEAGFLTDQLITAGVPVSNTSKTTPFVLTMSFQKEVHFN